MNSFKQLIQHVKSANWTGANQIFSEIMQQKVADKLVTARTTVFKEEREMTDAEKKKREDLVKGMKKNREFFVKKYGDRADDVMYATATKQAMGEETEGDSEYQQYFRTQMKKHGYASPSDIPDDKKDDFFAMVDRGYKAKDE